MQVRVLGKRIRELRKLKGMTGKELALLAKCQTGYLYEIENGRKRPSTKLVERIADALEVPPMSLYDDTDSKVSVTLDSSLHDISYLKSLPADASKLVIGHYEVEVPYELIETILNLIYLYKNKKD